MKSIILRTFALLLFIPMLGFASNNPVTPETIVITTNSSGEITDVFAPGSWTNGNLNNFYLDNTHTQKTFNDITLDPGRYQWQLTTKKNNGKQGKVNFDITVKFQGSSDSKLVDKKLAPGRSDIGKFNIEDYKSKSGSSSLAGYGKVKVHIGRAAVNTNVNYKIILTRIGGLPCNYTSLGSKSGNIVGNTLSKYTSTKKACKNTVKVKVIKTGGKAKTTVYVYFSSTKNGAGTLKKTVEFPAGNGGSPKNLTIGGANGKYVRVELKNRSAAKTFKFTSTITQ